MADETKVVEAPNPEVPAAPEPEKKEPEKKDDVPRDAQGDELYVPTYEDDDLDMRAKPAVADPVLDADGKPVEEKSKENAKPVEPVVTPAPAAKHSTAAIQQAAQFGIQASEIDEMTPKELERAIAIAGRTAQAAWDAGIKSAKPAETPAKPEVKASEEIELDFGVDDAGVKIDPKDVHPGIINAMKSLVKVVDQKWSKKFEESEKAAQQAAFQQTSDRVFGEVAKFGDAAVKALDRTTAAGQKNVQDFWQRMQALSQFERSEPALVKQVLASMGIAVDGAADKGAAQDAKVEAALEERKKEHDAGALAKPGSRVGKKNVVQSLREVLIKRGLPVAALDETPTEWEEG